jgi:hypothetical protein
MTTIQTKLSLLQRLRRWFRLVELKRQLAGAHADLSSASERIDLLEAAQFSDLSAEAKQLAFSRREMARVEMLDCFRRLDQINTEIKHIEQGVF